MSRMLSGFDLIRLEEKLRNEVSEKFGSTVWDSKELVGSDAYEMDIRSWRRMIRTFDCNGSFTLDGWRESERSN